MPFSLKKNLYWLTALLVPSLSFALSPMIEYRDLVAGNGEKGFKNGVFYSAEFNQPIGLALNDDGSVLYVADQKNNLIRSIFLNENNNVLTLAGSGNPGSADGPLDLATFNQPKDLVYLPHHQMAVFDQGSQLIRLIDLNKKTVSTIAGGGKTGLPEGDALKVQLGDVWNMVYDSQDHGLYFSLPEAGLLQKLDLESGKILTVLKNISQVPHPKALGVAGNHFYIADRDLTDVYEFFPPGHPLSADSSLKEVLKPVGQSLSPVLGLAGSEKALYVYQNNPGSPLYRLFPNGGPVVFPSGFGYVVTSMPSKGYFVNLAKEIFPLFQSKTDGEQAGFIFDPRTTNRFYIANPSRSFIGAVKDYGPCFTPEDHIDPLSPDIKPPDTFRIFVCGRSFIENEVDNRYFTDPAEANGEHQDEFTSISKRTEVELNTRAALEDNPVHFEVLRKTLKNYNLLVEAYWNVPQICAKYDLDMVLILKDDKEMTRTFDNLFLRPVDSDDVPVSQLDPEFLLKPIKERFPSGAYHDFIQYCLSKNLINPVAPNYYIFNDISSDSQARTQAMKILGQPLKMLKKKMDAMKTSGGKTPQLVFCYFPAGWDFFTDESQREFWKELCRQNGVTFLDLCDDFSVVGMSYHPYSLLSYGHFTTNGMDLFSKILVHELTRNKMIPTRVQGKPE